MEQIKLNKLEKVRQEHNLSHIDMAKKLNISRVYYWQIENGKRGLTYINATKIANILEVTPDDLFLNEFKNFLF